MCHEPNGMYRTHKIHCWRQFFTKEEKIEMLEEYKKRLEKEIEGVIQTIEKIKRAS